MTDENSLEVRVALGDRTYEIPIVSHNLPGFLARLNTWVTHRSGAVPGTALIVTDRNVHEPHARTVADVLRSSGWKDRTVVLEAGEQTKSLDWTATLYDQLVEMKADRQTLVIAVGGGVVGDLAGFVAATYARGIPFVQVPTTLLAQVDSSVGGKVGINHPRGKNLIGAFHQPLGVFIDTAVLETLPAREYRSGLAEVVKYGVILDAEFFAYLETNVAGLNERQADVLRTVVSRCCRLKADVVEQDEFERTGLRAVLNYGHTFAHAFEALCGYGVLLHGEAVSIGMHAAAELAEKLGRIGNDLVRRQERLLLDLELPIALPESCSLDAGKVLDSMKLDKKSVGGKLRFILPSRLGHVETVRDVPEGLVLEVLKSFRGIR